MTYAKQVKFTKKAFKFRQQNTYEIDDFLVAFCLCFELSPNAYMETFHTNRNDWRRKLDSLEGLPTSLHVKAEAKGNSETDGILYHCCRN